MMMGSRFSRQLGFDYTCIQSARLATLQKSGRAKTQLARLLATAMIIIINVAQKAH